MMPIEAAAGVGAGLVGISSDLIDKRGVAAFGHDTLRRLEKRQLRWEWFDPGPAVRACDLAAFDGLYINTPSVPASAFAALGGPARTRVIARHGVGYDAVDVAACTAAGVLVTIQKER